MKFTVVKVGSRALQTRKFVLLGCLAMAMQWMAGQGTVDRVLDWNVLSQEFLSQIKQGQNTEGIKRQLANATVVELENELDSDERRLAFWINIYNAYILELLSENPDLYNDKKSFFRKRQIPLAGKRISFEKIEHGILRKSQWPKGLGYVRKCFPNGFERRLRVANRDYRIHFALNCGARDCPPVAIYSPKDLDTQLEEATATYLQHTTSYDPQTREVVTSPLFQWFRGDFGGKKGILKILDRLQIIPLTKEVNLGYNSYDWSLDLTNWQDP